MNTHKSIEFEPKQILTSWYCISIAFANSRVIAQTFFISFAVCKIQTKFYDTIWQGSAWDFENKLIK